MLTQRSANIAFAIIVIAACGYFAWIAEGFEATGLLATSGLPSKFFPQLVLACTALSAAVVLARYSARRAEGWDSESSVFADAGEARRGLLVLAVAVACYVVWRNLGFFAMAAILGPSSLLAMGIRSLRMHLAILALTVLVYAAFALALGVRLE